MTATERVSTVVQNAPAEGKLAALITAIKHEVADALEGANLPPDNRSRLAAVFPDLEANTGRLHEAYNGKPGEAYSGEKDTSANRPGVQTHASLPNDPTSRALRAAGAAPGGTGASLDTDRVADRFSEPAADAQSFQGSAATATEAKPVKSGEAQLNADADKGDKKADSEKEADDKK